MAATARRSTRRPATLKVPLPRARAGRRLLPGIVRLDYERAKGYVVRLQYRREDGGWRPRFHQYFGDARYGSKAKALQAAERWLGIVTRTGKAPRGTR
jgi:hypothetical protein